MSGSNTRPANFELMKQMVSKMSSSYSINTRVSGTPGARMLDVMWVRGNATVAGPPGEDKASTADPAFAWDFSTGRGSKETRFMALTTSLQHCQARQAKPTPVRRRSVGRRLAARTFGISAKIDPQHRPIAWRTMIWIETQSKFP